MLAVLSFVGTERVLARNQAVVVAKRQQPCQDITPSTNRAAAYSGGSPGKVTPILATTTAWVRASSPSSPAKDNSKIGGIPWLLFSGTLGF